MIRAINGSRYVLILVATLSTLGCVTQQQVADAMTDVNNEFRRQYESILAQQGTRSVSATKSEAFDAMRFALARLGMQTESLDPGLGYLSVFAPAPLPLDVAEWNKATEADLPLLRQILRERIGILGDFVRFEPEGLQIVITATVLEARAGSEVSLTMRMREIAPPRSGIPRREYAPPTAVRMGLDKIWTAFDQELRLRSNR